MRWSTSHALSFLAAALSPVFVTGLQLPLSLAPPFKFAQSLQAGGVSTNLNAANFIFNGLDSLAQQLGNSVHPNGHALVPAVISQYTLLYHGRLDANLPPSPEWLAFDVEHSYAIMSSAGREAHMLTYSANRDLRVLYFDGMSAGKGGTGWLDTQEVLVNRAGAPVLSPRGWRDECNRIQSLCKWGKQFGVDGFIRMETDFEVMWCDFSDGLDIVSHLNFTVPDSPPSRPGGPWGPGGMCGRTSDPTDEPSALSGGIPHNGSDAREPPPEGEPPRRRRGKESRSPLTHSARYEWLRVASRRFLSPTPGLRPITSGLVTFYDAASFPSLAAARSSDNQTSMTQTRVWANISEADAQQAVERIEGVLSRPDLWTRGGVDWPRIARRMTEFWGARVAQMNATLVPVEGSDFNATRAVEDVRLLAYTLLDPYMDTSAFPHSNTSVPSRWLPTTLERCGRAPTASVPPPEFLTPEERVLRASIETVLNRLCGFAGTVLAQSVGENKANDGDLAQKWGTEVDALMNWLDWPMWLQCDVRCGVDWKTLCVVPMWPAFGYGMRWGEPMPTRIVPECVSFEDFVHNDDVIF